MGNYQIQATAEGIWLSVQTAVAAVVGWLLIEQVDMETVGAVIIAGAVGSASRPVLGYLFRYLPKPPSA